MAYIALKPCSFAGQKFKIDDSVPAELVLPGAVKNLLKMGVIANGETETTTETIVSAEITVKVNDLDLELMPDDVQAIFSVLTGEPADAENTIKTMTNGDALILLHLTDKRKAVKAAAEARAKEIEGEQ